MKSSDGMRRAWAATLIACALLAAQQSHSSVEYEMKATAVFNLAQFVDWPPSAFSDAESPFVIGVLGQNPFGKGLDRAVAGESVQKRRLAVKYGETLDALGPVHMLYISRSEARKLPEILRSLKRKSTLTVSDIDRFAQNGGMVNLVTTEDRVRMLVNPTQIEAASLRVSAKLLRIAELVKTE